MTLVELLVTILIISILGALVLGVAAVAGETAREARSRNMIARLHTLLVEHMDTYKTRRVKLRPEVTDAINNQPWNGTQKRRALAESRLYALRELMLMEMPDRWSDIALDGIASPATFRYPVYLDVSGSSNGRTGLASIYFRRYQQYALQANTTAKRQILVDNEGAECLYMIITLATGDGEARTLFHESNIGDTDGDGASEFLDGWGHPIEFIRWAPGFDSEIQANANNFTGRMDPDWATAATNDHDPYDTYRVDSVAFRLLPLIISVGRDEEFGLHRVQHFASLKWIGNTNANAPFNANSPRKLDPYLEITDVNSVTAYLGTADASKTATDNIHNHLIGER